MSIYNNKLPPQNSQVTQGIANKPIKSNVNQKIPGIKMALDLNKLDLKGTGGGGGPSLSLIKSKPGGIPINSIENIYLNNGEGKSPQGKQSPVPAILTEEYETIETIHDNKIYPQSTKNAIGNKSLPFGDKFRSAIIQNEKLLSHRQYEDGSPKDTKYEILKSGQLYKPKGIDDKSKKTANLTLTLQNISNIHHQEKLISPVGPNSAKGQGYDPLLRKISNTNAIDSKNITMDKNGIQTQNQTHNLSQYQNCEIEIKKPSPIPYSLNNFLADLGGLSTEQMKISKININNINNINTINNNNGSGNSVSNTTEKVLTPKEPSTQYKELNRILLEKTNEITKLNNEKQMLKEALDKLSNEVKEIKKMKIVLKDKEKMADNIQSSINDALLESNDLKRKLMKEYNKDYTNNNINLLSNGNVGGGGGGTPTDLDMMKNYMEQLKIIPNCNDFDEAIDRKNRLYSNHALNPKFIHKNSSMPKTDLSCQLSHLENQDEKNAYSTGLMTNNQLFQRNLSTTLEDAINRKLAESPYYEPIKNDLKKIKGNASIKKPSSSVKKNILSMNKIQKAPLVSSAIIKKGDHLLVETPRSGPTNTSNPLSLRNKINDKFEKLIPHTTTHIEFNPSKRKFSHDPKLHQENYIASFFNKKNSANPNPEDFREFNNANKNTSKNLIVSPKSTVSVDIPAALNVLKDRIKKLLGKHKNDHDKLRKINRIFLEKLESLNQSTA